MKKPNQHMHLVLGNQLFHPEIHIKEVTKSTSNSTVFFMREDADLCTHFQYHKHKIIFFLAAMRAFSKELAANKLDFHYEKLGQNKFKSFEQSLTAFIFDRKISSISFFEIEDKFFESFLIDLCVKLKIEYKIFISPMFLTSRDQFSSYLKSTKKPFMKTFYEFQRKRLKILINADGTPKGGRWSFDDENRSALPKDYQSVSLPNFSASEIEREVIQLTERQFPDHPGVANQFWLPTDRKGSQRWLQSFIQDRLKEFGPYEDALSETHDFVNHSVLTPFLNCGLITPKEVIVEVLKAAKDKNIQINSVEGFIRQIIGWREFVRGIYQNFSEKQDVTNFWNHKRKLTPAWYKGETGIAPLDHVIRKTVRIGYAHHIERLMVVGSLMLILEIDPVEAHRWFMEMFIDSSDWVMGPNVYGMALFSDGGIFATKPYFCGSNYYKKMGGYKTGDWQDAVDGLYWNFIEKNKTFFLKNPRMSMMVRSVEKMPVDKKKRIYQAAEQLKDRITGVV